MGDTGVCFEVNKHLKKAIDQVSVFNSVDLKEKKKEKISETTTQRFTTFEYWNKSRTRTSIFSAILAHENLFEHTTNHVYKLPNLGNTHLDADSVRSTGADRFRELWVWKTTKYEY